VARLFLSTFLVFISANQRSSAAKTLFTCGSC
jgi:hypothetical protein